MTKVAQLLILFILSSCSSQRYYFPEIKWQVSVVMPSFYPVSVTEAYGVNEEEDWTVMLHNFTLFMSRSELSNARNKLPNYDGYGLPLHPISVLRKDQIGGTRHLPDIVYIYWVSIINTQFYVTKYELEDSVKKLMSRKVSFQLPNGFVMDDCFRNELIFGLLPNGNAKVWLEGCGETIYVKELQPDQVLTHDSKGMSANVYKNGSLLARVKKRAEDEGVSIDPIPWEKVNKVYTNEPIVSLGEVLAR